MVIDSSTSAPPIVGVPCFDRCDCGPSLRTDCPIFIAVRRAMTFGPSTIAITSAVIVASTARTVM